MNETPLCLLLEMRSGLAVTLFGTIFLDEMDQNKAAVVLYSDNVSHLILKLLVYWTVVLNQYHICKLP